MTRCWEYFGTLQRYLGSHNIIQIHNNVLWDQQYYADYSIFELNT